MAGKKQSTAKGSASKAKSGAKSSAAKNTRSSGSKSNTKSRASSAKGKSTSSKQSAPSVEQLRQRNQTEAILWFGAAILTACFVLIPGGSVWLMVHNVLRGVFGGWAILLAVLMGYIAVSKTMEQTTMLRGGRLALMVVIVVLFCTAGHVFGSFFPKEKSFFKLVGILYMHGVEQGGAGLVGGLVGELLVKCAEVLGARIITGVLLFVSVLIFTGTSLASFFKKIAKPAVVIRDVARQRKEERRILEEKRGNAEESPFETVLPQHPVRSVPEDGKMESKNKGKTPRAYLEQLFGVRRTEPDNDPVVLHDYTESSAQINALIDENRRVPDFRVPGLEREAQPAQNVQPTYTPPVQAEVRPAPQPAETPETHVPVERETVEAPVIMPPVMQTAKPEPAPVQQSAYAQPAPQPAAPTILAPGSSPVTPAHSAEAAADAQKATEEFMKKKLEAERMETQPAQSAPKEEDSSYIFPPVTMLASGKKVDAAVETEELQTNGKLLVETLKSFGVQTKILDICRGPAVTRYELQPAAGVKISKITNLADDLAMNLAATGVRIEAPIPGKAAVGIEVPNKVKTIVRMRELVESNSFVTSKSHLTVALGRDIAGQVTVADLSKMPHILIAGTTGSGKSVCINSLIVSLLYKSGPDDVRFLMIDPKVVELGIYNGIPHLLVPVVTDPRKAAGALNWAVTEMLKRYKIFAENNVRDLKGYNALAQANNYQDENGQPMHKMPQIVIIIDELSDLMMAAPNEVEDAICRLAQMARAAGMHLVVATQRPSVDVVTGLIKANIPSRIAFAVSSAIDSRTILDSGGAEKLLGQGDMLFSPVGAQKPLRIQGCFVSDSEIESVVDFVKNSRSVIYDDSIAQEIERSAVEGSKSSDSGSNDDEGSGDPMMNEAIKCVVEAGQASTSLLQRRLRLGYARAGRLIDEMEQMGIVGPHEGSKPRQVLITYAQWLEMNMQKQDTPGDA